jgi:predicted nucleic acid-binding protein
VILADTSVWIDHFRSLHPEMQRLLARDEIAMHPFVAAELALGSLRDRARTLLYLDLLPMVRVAQLSEVRQMIEAHVLYSKGVGLTDAHLLASCLLTPGIELWTRDAALEREAKTLGILASFAKTRTENS